MVHALKEAWRMLVGGGIMVDVRPLSVVAPLEVEYDGGKDTAGTVDMTPDLKYDIAADQAIDQVLSEGIYTQLSIESFEYVDYWKTFHGMVVDFEERWEDEIIVSKEVLENARLLYRQKRPGTRMRLPVPMKLGKYVKKG